MFLYKLGFYFIWGKMGVCVVCIVRHRVILPMKTVESPGLSCAFEYNATNWYVLILFYDKI